MYDHFERTFIILNFLYFITELILETSLQSGIYYMVPRPWKNFVCVFIVEFETNQNGGSIRKEEEG